MRCAAAWIILTAALHAEAAVPEDFTCKGIGLGAAEGDMLTIFGEPMFDAERMTMGIHMKYYTFKNGYTVGVAVNTGKVLDIKIEDDRYEARDGIKIGATAYKIENVYGAQERVLLDGEKFYIYTNPEAAHERLLLSVDAEDNYLLRWRITELPLTEEEADEMALEDDWDNPDLTAQMMMEREIDTSALPEPAPVRLEMENA